MDAGDRDEAGGRAGRDLSWRPMTADDLDAVADLAVLGFPNHFEGRPCFANRLALFPRGCFVLAEPDGRPRGYLVAYPWRAEAAPTLNTLIAALPQDAAVLYLHDIALCPNARGAGRSRAIIERLMDQGRADGWPGIALVAVNDAAGFWARHGFSVREAPDMAAKLASYGPDARYMVRPL